MDQLVAKAIEKKKLNEQRLAKKSKPKLEYVLFSQFDVLDTLPSQNGKTTIYRLSKKAQPEKQICCKVVNNDASELADKLLLNEASRLEMSQHPSVAEFIKVGNEFERPYFMYEWVQGESVAEKMARYSSKGFRHDHIAWLVYQLAGALEFMHTRGICHLDIKPSNIMVSEGDFVKLIDFGAARYIGDVDTYAETSLNYASPLYVSTGQAEPQDDVYSLAMLAGHLFLGYLFGDAWHKQLKERKCPELIPGHIWKLLKEVINNPRSHGYTAISFAQQLARIDTQELDPLSSAPIFSSLRNADLLLTHCKPQDRFKFRRFKLLETGLVICLATITGTHLYQSIVDSGQGGPVLQYSLMQDPNVNTVNATASFLSQSPWKMESLISEMDRQDMDSAPYQNAYDIQQGQLKTIYNKNSGQLQSYQLIADELPKALRQLHKELVVLRKELDNERSLSPSVEQSLSQVMVGLNVAASDSFKLSAAVGSKSEQLAELILDGEVALASDEIKAAWLLNQSKSYFYSHALPEQIMVNIYKSIDELAGKDRYTEAISEAKLAKSYFGNQYGIDEKIKSLSIDRSKYILFSTVQGQDMFEKDKLRDSLAELEANDPTIFNDVATKLQALAADYKEKSHQFSRPGRGATAIEKALEEYLSEDRG
nr:protein kinase [Vibrio intestinalis]